MSVKTSLSRITLLSLFVIIAIAGVMVAILPVIQKPIYDDWVQIWPNFTVGHLGLITVASTYISTGLGVLFGYMGDKFPRIKVIIIGGIISSVFSIFTFFATNYLQLFFFQVIVAVGNGSMAPAIYSIFSDSYKSENRGSAFAWLSIITGFIGGLIGTLLFVEIALIDWHLPYLIMGIIGLAFIPILFLLKEPPRGGSENGLADIYKSDPSLSFQYVIKPEDIKYLWKRRSNLFLIPNLVDNIPGGILFTYGVSWLAFDHGLNPDNGLILLALVGLLSMVGTFGFAHIGDKRLKSDNLIRIKLGIILSISTVPFVLLGVNIPWDATGLDLVQTLMTPIVLTVALIIGAGMALDAGIYPNWLSAITEINLPEQRSTMISLGRFFDACGTGLGELIGALILIFMPGEYTFMMSFAVLFTFLSFIWWVPALKFYRKDYEEVQNILSKRAEELKPKVKSA